MSESIHFAYKNDGIKTDEIDLSSVAEYLPPKALIALQKTIEGAISPLVEELSNLREVVGRQAERITALESQQATNIRNLEIAFSANIATRERVEDLEDAPDKVGPGTEDQQEQIKDFLQKKPDHRATFGELRDLLNVTKSRFSQIIRDAGFAVLQHRHDRRRRSLKLPAIF